MLCWKISHSRSSAPDGLACPLPAADSWRHAWLVKAALGVSRQKVRSAFPGGLGAARPPWLTLTCSRRCVQAMGTDPGKGAKGMSSAVLTACSPVVWPAGCVEASFREKDSGVLTAAKGWAAVAAPGACCSDMLSTCVSPCPCTRFSESLSSLLEPARRHCRSPAWKMTVSCSARCSTGV